MANVRLVGIILGILIANDILELFRNNENILQINIATLCRISKMYMYILIINALNVSDSKEAIYASDHETDR